METTGNVHKLAAQIAKGRKIADAMALSQQPEEYWVNPPLEAWKILADVVKVEPPSAETVLLAQTIYKERKVGERLLALKTMGDLKQMFPPIKDYMKAQQEMALTGKKIMVRGVEMDEVAPPVMKPTNHLIEAHKKAQPEIDLTGKRIKIRGVEIDTANSPIMRDRKKSRTKGKRGIE